MDILRTEEWVSLDLHVPGMQRETQPPRPAMEKLRGRAIANDVLTCAEAVDTDMEP